MNTVSEVLPAGRRRAIRRQHHTALFTLVCLTGLGMAVVFAAHGHVWWALAAGGVFVGFGWPAFLGLADPTAGQDWKDPQ